jgi:hypothetical protein
MVTSVIESMGSKNMPSLFERSSATGIETMLLREIVHFGESSSWVTVDNPAVIDTRKR